MVHSPINTSPSLPHPLWRLGFRPFFLAASLFAITALSFWMARLNGGLDRGTPFNPVLWHAHEMIYGYTPAVIAGFVLTASQNWTGKRGVHGYPLMLLVALWWVARLLSFILIHPQAVASFIDLSFYPALGWALYPYLRPADMKEERVFFVYFLLYFAGNLLMHLEALDWLPGYGMKGALLGLHTTLLMIVLMGGRVIPFFSESEKSRSQPRIFKPVEILSHLTAWGVLISQFFFPQNFASAVFAIVASGVHAVRLIGWYVRRVRRVALLWVLYSSYLWISVGYLLVALTSLGVVPLGSSVHALTVGGLGIITYGMMSRVALGHTGRRLKPALAVMVGYGILNGATAIRVFGPLFLPSQNEIWHTLSGTLWIVAFVLFTATYAPLLLSPRPDGRAG